ncbi:MAG: anti-sigma factor family protein, partial [Pseudomonadota bacterium]
RRFRPLAAAAAFVAVGSALGFGAARLGSPPAGGLDFAQAALLAHRTFAPEVTHPVEMSAADPERLAAWLGRRVGRPLTLPDFSPEGFRLVGGRILPDPDGPAAALMYEDSQGRRVTLYLAPEPGVRETALRLVEGGGTQGWWWVEDGFGCAVVGDAPRDVLKVMAARAYEALG